MRKYLAFAAFLILPLAFGYVLYDQLLDWELYAQWVGATGVLALALLSLAAISRDLCRVVLWLPREETMTRASLLGTYLFAAPHAGLFLSTWVFEDARVEFSNTAWVVPWALGIAALLLLLAVPLRRLLLRSPLAIPRWTVLVAIGMALLHGRMLGLVVGRADENERWFSNQLASRNGHYAIPLFLVAWILLVLFDRFKVRFRSPIPRFSLLTLLLIPCAGFSGVVLYKHWIPWSVERTLAQAEEITNAWGSFKDPSAALSPDGSHAFSATPEGPALFWNCSTGVSLGLTAHTGEVFDARFSPDGSQLAVITRPQCLFQRENEAAPYVLKRTFPLDAPIPDDVKLLLNADQAMLTEWHALWLYDCASLRVIACVAVGTMHSGFDSFADYSFSADSSQLLTLSSYQGAYLWDTGTGKLRAHRFLSASEEGQDERVTGICVKSTNGWRLILDKPDFRFGEFAIASHALPALAARLRENYLNYSLSPDDSFLILGHHRYEVEIVNVRDASTLWRRTMDQLPNVGYSSLRTFCFDSTHILAALDNRLEILKLSDGKTVSTHRIYDQYWHRILIHNGPALLAPKEGVLAVLDTRSLQAGTIFEAEADQPSSPFASIGRTTLSFDGRWLIDVGSKGTVRIWKNRHPPQWWGIGVLPEFWLTLLFSGALLWSIVRDRRLNAASTSGAPPRA